jgi:hypothetical protein
VRVVSSTSVDLDRDDRPDVVAVLACEGAVAANQAIELAQAVAFSRAGRGPVTVLGQVMATSADTGRIAAVLPAPDGVRVLVRDNPLAGAVMRQQERTFSYDGQHFRQTDGPTEFGPNPDLADLAVSAAPVDLAGGDGTAGGELRVEVRNQGMGPAPWIDLDIYDETGTLTISGVGCVRLGTPEARGAPFQRTGPGASYWCQSGMVPAGGTTVLTVVVSGPAGGSAHRLHVALLAGRSGPADADPTDNAVEVPVRVG